jgi:hypothetical protein
MWTVRKLEISLIKKMFQIEGEQSSANGFLRLKGTAYFELDWWPVAIAKFQGLTSMKVLPLLLSINAMLMIVLY